MGPLKIAAASIIAANTVSFNNADRFVDLFVNIDGGRDSEYISFYANNYNNVFVYRYNGLRKTKPYISRFEDGREVYYTLGQGEDFIWGGSLADTMSVDDFNDDGLKDVLYYKRGENRGMMLRYNRLERKLVLEEVEIEPRPELTVLQR